METSDGFRHQTVTVLVIASCGMSILPAVIELGLNHEQQHQELILTDLKHLFSLNPLHPVYRDPVYRERALPSATTAPPLRWHRYKEGLRWIGHDDDGFSFDMDAESVFIVSRLSPTGWRAGRIQRQVHVQSDGAARRFVRNAAIAHPRQLSQLLPARGALAVQRYSISA